MTDTAERSGLEAVRRAMEEPADGPLPSVRRPAEVRAFAPRREREEEKVARRERALPPAPPAPPVLSEEAAALVSKDILDAAKVVADTMIAAAVAHTKEAQDQENATRQKAEFILRTAREDAERIATGLARGRAMHDGVMDLCATHEIQLAAPCADATEN